MTKFARILSEAVENSGLTVSGYAHEWEVPTRTLGHWMKGSLPSPKWTRIIEERFNDSGLFEEETLKTVSNGHQNGLATKIILAKTKVIDMTFVFEWLVLSASVEERKKFREELGSDWEYFMNLARALVSEKSREVIRNEGSFNSFRRQA